MSRATEIDVKAFMKQSKKIPVLNKNVEYISPKEYAKKINAHQVTVFKWLSQGKIEGAFKADGRWKIPVAT